MSTLETSSLPQNGGNFTTEEAKSLAGELTDFSISQLPIISAL